jgi:hypothetical protein
LESKAVVSVNITDANAHAWVEVYTPEQGWIVADVTPASQEEESDNGFWQRLLNFLGGNDQGEEDASNTQEAKEDTSTIKAVEVSRRVGVGILFLGAFLFTIIIVKWSVKAGVSFRCYLAAGYNDRLVMEYHRYLERVSGREKELRQKRNYKQQIRWLMEHGYWDSTQIDIEQAISLMEQAGFSNRQLTRQEYFQVRSCFLKKGVTVVSKV